MEEIAGNFSEKQMQNNDGTLKCRECNHIKASSYICMHMGTILLIQVNNYSIDFPIAYT